MENNSMSRYFAEIRVPPFTKGKRENTKVYSIVLNVRYAPLCWVSLGVSLLMLIWYLCVRNTDCPKTPISRPEEKRGDPRETVSLTSSNYSEGPVSTLLLLCDGMLNQVPIL